MSNLDFLQPLREKYSHEPTFLQAVEEMAMALLPLFEDEKNGAFYKRAFVAMTEPERVISFRVPWEDDNGNIQFNRGWRVEFNSVLGPYKGGLRLHPTVDSGVLKFLGFEQIFKNALTGLPMGGGKGGSDFNPKGKSEGEVRRFCVSFMTELFRYLHPSTDVPAGDIGVGGREIGYLYGQYKRLTNKHGEGVLTGKGLNWGGSPLRPEATGYGLVYMTKLAVEKRLGRTLEAMRCAVSGSGNVAQFASEKLLGYGAKVITVSDSNGVLVFDDGMTQDDLHAVMECKNVQRDRLRSLDGKVSGRYVDGESPWSLDMKYDLALPCATQNEIDGDAARRLVKNGVLGVLEGANLPTNMEAQKVIRDKGDVIYVPGKASNAGGVGVSGLEMSQNSQRLTWTREEVDSKLKDMMANIYKQMENSSGKDGTLEEGANRAGFLKVAEAMKDLGWVQ
ncbi:NADP-specific glutamate dehydrogenase [Seminavis robusta]|uniref:Glutamate dehydrogenase n=1 Tax=Seminavis robusta TaxID=568900 RepID=A0A9N8EHY5_9STRA|nr:NADP-specific glutamate dehydrogenase [Seminavis robusta]|eukprot:Sro982_g227610.1 NADP-specific glutamate dehydrogenase (449) ;mRNA; r:4639-6359